MKRLFLAGVVLAALAAGCGGGTESAPAVRAAPPGPRMVAAGLSFMLPSGWNRVGLGKLPGALGHVLELASFHPRGALSTICAPGALTSQIPAGGALLQVLVRRPRAEGIPSSAPASSYPRFPRPFRLGRLDLRHECGEAYDRVFRRAGRLLQLRIWTDSDGELDASVRTQIGDLIDGLRGQGGPGHNRRLALRRGSCGRADCGKRYSSELPPTSPKAPAPARRGSSRA